MFSVNAVSAQKNVIEKSEDQIKLFNAQQLFYAGSFQASLNVYNDVLKSRPNDANILFHIAECYFGIAQYPQALEYANKAKNIDVKANENIYVTFFFFFSAGYDSFKGSKFCKSFIQFPIHEIQFP